MAMLYTRHKYSVILSAISLILAHALILSNTALAVSLGENDTLSASSRFNNVVHGPGFTISDREAAPEPELVEEFKGEVGPVYVSKLIGQVLVSHGSAISAKVQKRF